MTVHVLDAIGYVPADASLLKNHLLLKSGRYFTA